MRIFCHYCLSLFLPLGLLLTSAATVPGQVILSEFMASNSETLRDEEGEYTDWIEIHNTAGTSVHLLDWSLTDDAGDLRKWRFPDVTLGPRAFLVVFASGENRREVEAPLHTNFRLAIGGEYLALVEPDGSTVATEFAPAFPPQTRDVAYGFGMQFARTTLIAPGADARYFVPTDDSLGTNWVQPNHDDSSWATGSTGLGFVTGPLELDYPDIQTNVEQAMHNINASLLLRIPFTVDDLGGIGRLILRMKYDDGFAAFFNGVRVSGANDPDLLTRNSAALGTHEGFDATTVQDFDVSEARSLLRNGTNLLAIHALNRAATNNGFLQLPQLDADSFGALTTEPRYLVLPTPGEANGAGSVDLGPIISQVGHNPNEPADGDDLIVTAKVTPAFIPVNDVTLTYRVMYGPEQTLTMFDDGSHHDGAAGDFIFGAVIPATVATNGQMIRYYLRGNRT